MIDPGSEASLVELALARLNAGDREAARQLLASAGSQVADHPLALQILALAVEPGLDAADALALLERAVQIAPGDTQAHFNLAVCLQQQGSLDDAVLHYRHALRSAPTHLPSLNNLSDLLRRRRQAEEGWQAMERYREAGGEVGGLELRYAKLAMDTRRFKDAEYWFDRAEEHDPDSAMVQWEYAMLSLMNQDYKAGWAQYESRFVVKGSKLLGVYQYDIPEWTGESLSSSIILLHHEQGLGDMIMFSSMFEDIIASAKKVHIAVQPPLARLMRENFPKASVWSSKTSVFAGVESSQAWRPAAGSIDYQLPIGSLGRFVRPLGLPDPVAYIHPVAGETEQWIARLDRLAPRGSGQRRIGLVCAARRVDWNDDAKTNGERKSIPPRQLSQLARIPNVQWISLHDRATAAVMTHIPDLDVVDCSPWINDLADTAALINALDEVVSVDTAVAHLAGAMGKPVHLLLQFNPDWRWGRDRQTSVWYPDVQLYQQSSFDDWKPVLARLVLALSSGEAGCEYLPDTLARQAEAPVKKSGASATRASRRSEKPRRKASL